MVTVRPRLPVVLATSLVLAASLNLAACASNVGAPSAAGPSTPTTATPMAPASLPAETATPSAPTPVASFIAQLPAQACCRGLELDAGRYALPGFLGPLLEIAPDAGWEMINDGPARYIVFGGGVSSVGTMSRLVNLLGTPAGTTSQAVVGTITAMDTLVQGMDAATADVAGFRTTVIDATAKANPDNHGDPAADVAAGTVELDALEAFVEPGFRLSTSSPEARLRFLVMEVGSRVVVIMLEAPADEADSFFAQATLSSRP